MKKTIPFFIFLFLISCLGQTSSDVYLPALPTIRAALHTSEHWMQLSLALFMFGFSVSHLIYGPISDHTGRKKPLVIGIGICITGSLLCLFSSNLGFFLSGRFLQGAGAGAGAALFLSILRDVYDGNKLSKIGSFLGISRVVLLACSPLIGSYLLNYFNWRACFAFLFVYAAICFAGSVLIYKETHSRKNHHKIKLFSIFKNIGHVFSHAIFMRYAFCVMLAFGGILAWLTTLPFLLQDVVGLTPIQFGWVSAITGLFFIVGGFINAMIVERFQLQKMLLVGLCIMLMGSIVMLIFGLMHIVDTLVIMLPVVIYILGSSFVFPNAYAGAMHSFSEIAGTAGAVFGFLQILGGAISSSLMSIMKNYNQVPLAIVLLLSAIAALIAVRVTSKRT